MKKPDAEYDFRKEAVELLKLLSSESEQLDYEKNVPHVDITAELVCMWFDDFLHERIELQNENISPTEIQTLSEFHHFYEKRIELLPESYGTVKTWHENKVWKEIMLEASNTLTKMAEPVASGQRR